MAFEVTEVIPLTIGGAAHSLQGWPTIVVRFVVQYTISRDGTRPLEGWP